MYGAIDHSTNALNFLTMGSDGWYNLIATQRFTMTLTIVLTFYARSQTKDQNVYATMKRLASELKGGLRWVVSELACVFYY